MKTLLQYLRSILISIILIFGTDGCSDNSSNPSSSTGTPSNDSLFYQVDSLYVHGVPGFLSYSDTIPSCNFKSVRVTFSASTNDTSNGPNSAGFGIGFTSIHYPINTSLGGIELIGRKINYICDSVLNVYDTISHDLRFGYTLATHNQPYGDTTRFLKVTNLKIYKHN